MPACVSASTGWRRRSPAGRDDAADDLTYFRFRVTVENRTTEHFGIHLEDGQIDIRVGPDGESAFLDWRNSQFIEGFDVYPLRRATAVLFAADPTPRCTAWTSRWRSRWTTSGPSASCGPAASRTTRSSKGTPAPTRPGTAWPVR